MNQQSIALYTSVWVKALKEGKIKLSFRDHKECYRARFALYSVKTLAKKGKLYDPRLLEALEKCTIYLDKSDWSLLISSELEGELNAQIAAAIGFAPEDAPAIESTQYGEASQIAASAKKLIEKLAEPEKVRSTPYYTREEK